MVLFFEAAGAEVLSDVGGAEEGMGGGVSEGFAFAWQHQTVAKPGERGGGIL